MCVCVCVWGGGGVWGKCEKKLEMLKSFWTCQSFGLILKIVSVRTKKYTEILFLVHLSRRLKCTIVIICCPSSVVRPSSLTFHIFDFSSETAEQNLTELYRKVDLNILYQVCVFRADRKNKSAALASDWLRHFRLLL